MPIDSQPGHWTVWYGNVNTGGWCDHNILLYWLFLWLIFEVWLVVAVIFFKWSPRPPHSYLNKVRSLKRICNDFWSNVWFALHRTEMLREIRFNMFYVRFPAELVVYCNTQEFIYIHSFNINTIYLSIIYYSLFKLQFPNMIFVLVRFNDNLFKPPF